VPTSNLAVWPHLLWLVEEAPHEHVLDVGPGWGKAATLLREYLNVKPLRIDAVEVHKPYVDAHGLTRLYDEVLVGDVLELDPATLAGYDLVLMADVIEHLELAAAMELLARIPGRVVISTPEAFFSNGPGLPESETHRSHWTPEVWERVAEIRGIESQALVFGGWLVRLAPLS
jgi:2-polyprenyl-3-methyl-5-hydroxy-6-metoxy-1,4-benzoquinol methylase